MCAFWIYWYWHNCSCGIVGGHAIAAKFGSILWNRWRNIESGLVSIEKSSLWLYCSFLWCDDDDDVCVYFQRSGTIFT